MDPTVIGHYRIVGKLGEGGMGAVYRATDPKLNRDVAIKVLPPGFASDAARMQRFEREAQLLASLNHPNIATVYGTEEGAIVMELVEGADLAGPVPMETAIEYARQIAAGLEAAHERGIIHRDLKPANIKVTPDGTVKLLDFGLAKATEQRAAAASSPTISPTLSLAMTQAGMILGTAAYMSPEQARGYPVDRRADIWAFGVVLFEMLTGKHLYGGGETVTDTLAAVVLKEPDFSLLPADTPPRVRRLLERCLRKDPKLRMRDIGEARLALDEPETVSAAVAPVPARRAWLPWAVAGVSVLAAGIVAAAGWMREKPPEPVPVRFVLPLPEGMTESRSPAGPQAVPSPDGRQIAFIATDAAAVQWLWVRPVGSTSAHRLDKTEGATFPFWSPDSQQIGFFADQKLKKVSLAGGAVQTLCPAMSNSVAANQADGGTWSRDGVIVFSAGTGTLLQRVSASGGMATPVPGLEKNEDGRPSWPQFLPDGKHLLYFLSSLSGNQGLYVQEIGSANRVLVRKTLSRGMWASPGYLLFTAEGALFSQRMDPKTFQLSGEPRALAQEVSANETNGRNAIAVSESGVLVYREGLYSRSRQLAWYDRAGQRVAHVGQTAEILNLTLSPDGKNAAVVVGDLGKSDLWMMDLGSAVLTPLTRTGDAELNIGPWSPDSKQIAHNRAKGRIDLVDVASRNATMLAPEGLEADGWSPDGRSLICVDGRVGMRLSLLPVAEPAKPQVQLNTPYRQTSFRYSPDGKFVTYVSGESGTPEVFVASFPGFAQKRQISTGGGNYPAWSGDGKELFFRRAPRTLMSVTIRLGETIEAGVPTALFEYGVEGPGNRFGVAPDGRRFLIVDREQKGRGPADTVVVLNWAAELKP